jgi:hypothetical protein
MWPLHTLGPQCHPAQRRQRRVSCQRQARPWETVAGLKGSKARARNSDDRIGFPDGDSDQRGGYDGTGRPSLSCWPLTRLSRA